VGGERGDWRVSWRGRTPQAAGRVRPWPNLVDGGVGVLSRSVADPAVGRKGGTSAAVRGRCASGDAGRSTRPARTSDGVCGRAPPPWKIPRLPAPPPPRRNAHHDQHAHQRAHLGRRDVGVHDGGNCRVRDLTGSCRRWPRGSCRLGCPDSTKGSKRCCLLSGSAGGPRKCLKYALASILRQRFNRAQHAFTQRLGKRLLPSHAVHGVGGQTARLLKGQLTA
jgi:hypothetical protein